MGNASTKASTKEQDDGIVHMTSTRTTTVRGLDGSEFVMHKDMLIRDGEWKHSCVGIAFHNTVTGESTIEETCWKAESDSTAEVTTMAKSDSFQASLKDKVGTVVKSVKEFCRGGKDENSSQPEDDGSSV